MKFEQCIAITACAFIFASRRTVIDAGEKHLRAATVDFRDIMTPLRALYGQNNSTKDKSQALSFIVGHCGESRRRAHI